MKINTVLVLKVMFGAWSIFGSIAAISLIKDGISTTTWQYFWDFIKVVMGPATGAGIAFYVNDYVHKQRKKDEERTKIYGASYAIGTMLGDFINLKLVVREMLAEADAYYASCGRPYPNPNAYARPQVVTFVQKAGVDLSSLHFLLSFPEGRRAYQHLEFLNRTYTNLITAHESLNAVLIERQKKFDAASEDERENKTEQELIGLMTYTAARDFLVAVIVRVENDEKIYINATNALAEAADAYLAEITPLKHKGYDDQEKIDEKMKPLPPLFVNMLKEINE